MVAFGTVLLTLSNYKKGMTLEDLRVPASWNAMVTAYLTTFVFLFSRLSTNDADDLLYDVALNCRPLLYGLIINVLLKSDFKMPRRLYPVDQIIVHDSKTDLKVPIDIIKQKLMEVGLTEREIEIAIFINSGLSNRNISDKLYISESTVKKHTSNFYRKINISNREQLKQYIKELPYSNT
jgi:DNA-binding CsgD family transcriptional regulator